MANKRLRLFDQWRKAAEATTIPAGTASARGIEAHFIHAASVAVSREHRRAKTLVVSGIAAQLRAHRSTLLRELKRNVSAGSPRSSF
jgi:hypothetical protein